MDPEIYSGCEPRLTSFTKGELEEETSRCVDRVPSIKMLPASTMCRIAPVLIEPAHLKEAVQQQLTTEERGLVDVDARANPGHRVTHEVLRFVKEEEPHEEDPEELGKDIGGQPSTSRQPAFEPPTVSKIQISIPEEEIKGARWFTVEQPNPWVENPVFRWYQ